MMISTKGEKKHEKSGRLERCTAAIEMQVRLQKHIICEHEHSWQLHIIVFIPYNVAWCESSMNTY